MVSDKLKLQLERLQDNVFIDEKILDDLKKRIEAGEIPEPEAIKQLRKLERTGGPFFLSSKQVNDEWESLSRIIDDAEKRAKKLASSQFHLGLAALPIFIAVILLSLLFGWHQTEGSKVVAAILAACMTAIAAHSYLLLRIHQQASLAAERLSEKRVGILFLRIAVSREKSEDTAKLIEAGTTMFLGHHVAATIPLQAEDYSVTRKHSK